jgi:hypothetical protein
MCDVEGDVGEKMEWRDQRGCGFRRYVVTDVPEEHG